MRGRIFNQLQGTNLKRNLFDLSHEKKLSMNMGNLIPVLLEEIVPGDKFRVRTEQMIRLAPMLAPVMHRINVFIHYFFVPTRIIWDNYEDFFTGGKDGKTFPVLPVIACNETNRSYVEKGSLADYMGIPPPKTGAITDVLEISALPFRAYQQIYNDYYRDQNLSDAVPFPKDDTVGYIPYLMALRNRAYEKDYFSSGLPDTQRGDDITIPTTIDYRAPAKSFQLDGTTPSGDGAISVHGGAGDIKVNTVPTIIDNIEGFSSTINDLRTSVRLQEFLEKSMRGGARYVEHVLSFFGVRSKDSRQMRAEYLGGGRSPIVISEVLATMNNEDTDGGQMYGHGISASANSGFQRFFSEHGYVIGIMSVLPRTTYQQGVDRMWLKKDRYEFFYPQFAHLGEQAIQNKELYFDWQSLTNENQAVFAYTPRYAEYKYRASSIHGDFRDNLDFWHLGRIFASRPILNESFVQADPATMTRIFADESATHKLYVQLYNDVKAIRCMPIFGTPML